MTQKTLKSSSNLVSRFPLKTVAFPYVCVWLSVRKISMLIFLYPFKLNIWFFFLYSTYAYLHRIKKKVHSYVNFSQIFRHKLFPKYFQVHGMNVWVDGVWKFSVNDKLLFETEPRNPPVLAMSVCKGR